MAPVPKKKHTRSRSNKRKNAPSNRPSLPNLGICKSCGKPKQSHRVCLYCGAY